MRSFALASGSSGNCFYLESSSGFSCLVDLGLSFKKMISILDSRDVDINKIDCVFITHEHIDHCCGLVQFLKNTKNDVKIYLTKGTFNALKVDVDVFGFDRFVFVQSREVLKLDCGQVFIIDKMHDASEPVSFVFEFDGSKVGFFTDLGVVAVEVLEILKSLDVVYFEANYCSEFLKNKKMGFFNWNYVNRLTSDVGHLGVDDACDVLGCVSCNDQKIVLSHISQNTNTYENTYVKVKEALMKVGKFPELLVSFQGEATEWVE